VSPPQDPSPVPWHGAHLPPGWYRWGLITVALLGTFLRVAHIARPFNGLEAWNEGHYAMIALNFDRYGLWSQRDELGVDHTFSPGVPWLIWVCFKLFGATEWAARLPMAVSGVAVIFLVAALLRRLMGSEQIAFVSASLAAVAPGFVYFSQNTQLDMPAIAAALAGAVLIVRYRDHRRVAELAAAGVLLAVAVWLKFTMALAIPGYMALWWPSRPKRWALATAGALAVLPMIPSLLWMGTGRFAPGAAQSSYLSGWIAQRVTWQFYHRRWDARGLIKALTELPLIVEAHLFIVIFALACVGVPLLFRWRRQLPEVWIWLCPWLVQYLVAPWDSLANRYYDLPALSVGIVTGALGLWALARRRVRGSTARVLPAALAATVLLTAAYDIWDPIGDRVARATMAHAPAIDPRPFDSAKIVANLPAGLTAVDWPQTMFYAGGDPAWAVIVGDGRDVIDDEIFDYIVLNDYGHGIGPDYVVDDALRDRFARHHYIQIAPAAWAHERTMIADLGGYSDQGRHWGLR
jgi:4-amino-4-deoxy-L-arabinose transferase-like glycosyltransferase